MRDVMVFWRALSGRTRACTRCGAKNVFPDPGPLGAVGDLFGLARYMCSDCRHRFWLRSASHPHHERHAPGVEEAAPPAPEPSAPPEAPEPLAALDVGPPTTTSGPPDLSLLDADLARLRDRAAKNRKRRRRASLDGTLGG